MRFISFFILTLAIPVQGFAIDAYKCTVTDAKGLSDNGLLEPDEFSQMFPGKEFVLDKGTGRITGGLSNHNGNGQPEVLDYGSTEQAFKAITIFRPFVTVEYLYIEEFNRSNLKPFMLIDGAHIFTGICEPY